MGIQPLKGPEGFTPLKTRPFFAMQHCATLTDNYAVVRSCSIFDKFFVVLLEVMKKHQECLLNAPESVLLVESAYSGYVVVDMTCFEAWLGCGVITGIFVNFLQDGFDFTLISLTLGLVQIKMIMKRMAQQQKRRVLRWYWVHPIVLKKISKEHLHLLYHKLL